MYRNLIKQNWSEEELLEIWKLSKNEYDFIFRKKIQNKLSYAIKLKYYQNYGCTINDLNDIANCIIVFLSKQLKISLEALDNYQINSRVSRKHNKEIREYLRFRKINLEDLRAIKKELFKGKLADNCNDRDLKELFYNNLYQNKIERPSAPTPLKYGVLYI